MTDIKQSAPNAPLAYGVFARRATNGAVIVLFFTESGFPALHSGYLYCSTGKPDSADESKWPIIEKMRNNWFFFSN
ncbi:MAG: hypothetical protein JWR26_1421 [Pedosphaera sp.]|nr:hypothetical protein [Pedosphaera sp.]